jgi:hypothetical protein
MAVQVTIHAQPLLDKLLDRYIEVEKQADRYKEHPRAHHAIIARARLGELGYMLHLVSGENFIEWIKLVDERKAAGK